MIDDLQVVERVAVAISVVDAAGVHRYRNPAAVEILARLRVRAEGKPLETLEWGAVDVHMAPMAIDDLPVEVTRRTGRATTDVEVGFPGAGGELRWLRISTRPLPRPGGPHWVLGTFTDVTDTVVARRAQQEEVRRAAELFTTAFSAAPIGMALVGLDGRWLRVNDAICRLLGRTAEELLATTFQELTHPDDLDADLALLQDVLAGRRTSYTLIKRYLRPDGGIVRAQLSVSLVKDADGAPLHFISQLQDMTEHHALEERLRRLAEEDPLTHLSNRRRFEEELERQLERCARFGEPAAVVVIDLDRFKQVNDTRGHHVGDQVLVAAASALRARRRGTDVVARVGGDEFAAILVGVDAQAAEVAAAGFTSAIAAEIAGLGVGVITASAGVAAIDAGLSADQQLVRADRAMYAAKSSRHDR